MRHRPTSSPALHGPGPSGTALKPVCTGAFCNTPSGRKFLPAPPLYQDQVEALLADAMRRIGRQVRRLLLLRSPPNVPANHRSVAQPVANLTPGA